MGPSGCDDGGPGSSERPFCTVQRGVDALHAGMTLSIRAGRYVEAVAVRSSGTAGAPIRIAGEPGAVLVGPCPRYPCREEDLGGAPVADGVIRIERQHHVRLESLSVVRAAINGVSVQGSQSIDLVRLESDESGQSGISIYDSSDVTVTGCRIERANLGLAAAGEDAQYPDEALTLSRVTRFDVSSNTVENCRKEGIDVKLGSADGEVRDNRIRRVCSAGIYVNEASRVRVHHNGIEDTGFWDPGAGRVACTDPTSGDPWDGGDGILIAVGDLLGLGTGRAADVRVDHNTIWGAAVSGIMLWDELADRGVGTGRLERVRIEHNTIWRAGLSGWGAGAAIGTGDDVSVRNNIFAHVGGGGIESGERVGQLQITHNLFFRSGEPAGSSAVQADPLLIDPDRGDLRPGPGSPAIDAGVDIGEAFVGTAPDIGAYETEPGRNQ